MQDKFLISNKVKKTIIYIEKMTDNYPKTECVLKNKIIDTSYELLKYIYEANIYKEEKYMKKIIVEIRMLEFYIKKSYAKKLISIKKYEVIGNHLLEINKMVNSWILSEKNK